MSHSPADGIAMVAAAQKTNRIVQVGAQRTSSVLCAKAKELYQQGAIGDLSLVEARWAETVPQAPGNIPLPPTYPCLPWIGTRGLEPLQKGRSIPSCLLVGVVGENMELVLPGTCWFI